MKRIIMLSLIIGVFFLSGCNKEPDNKSISINDVSKDDMYLYSSENLFEDFQYIFLTENYNTGFYAYASKKEKPEKANLYYCDIEKNSTDELTYEVDNKFSILSISSSTNGDLWILEYNNIEEIYRINIYSGSSIALFEHNKIMDSTPLKIIVNDTNKTLFIHSLDLHNDSEYIYVYNFSGELLSKTKCNHSLTSLIYSEYEEHLFMTEYFDNKVTISMLDQVNNSVIEIITIESVTDGVLFMSSTSSFNIFVNSTLMNFDFTTKSLTPIFNMLANGLSGQMRFIHQYGDKYILICREVSNIDVVVKIVKTHELQESKEKITLATLGSDFITELAVTNFNRTNSRYYIEIVDYSVYGDEAISILNTEIIAGKLPDIFDMNGLSIKKYISSGILENLDPYMKNDLNMEDLWDSALSALYVDDGCYVVVPGFFINTVSATKEVVNEIDGLNFNGIMNYIKENSNNKKNAFGNHMTQMEFIMYILSCNLDRFINYETKECYFNSDEFITLIETASQLAPYEGTYDETFEIYFESQPISIQCIRGVSDFDLLAAIYKDNFATTSLSGNTISSGTSMIPLKIFGMSARSGCKDGVWEFLKSLYSNDFQQFMSSGGIPMSKASFDAGWDAYKKNIEQSKENGILGFTYLSIVDGVQGETLMEFSENRLQCYQNTIDLINKIDRFYQVDEVDTIVMEIINEAFQACLNGDKSAADVADEIQRRVNIYINE